MKLCTKCGNPGEFNKNKCRPDGRAAWCQTCTRAYRLATVEESRAKDRALRAADPEGQRARDRAKYRANPTSAHARCQRWRETHPEAARAAGRSLQHKVTAAGWRLANRERHRASIREWCKNNPDRRAIYNARRRAAVAAVEATLILQEWKDILEYFAYSCAYCLRNDVPMTLDHVIAISRGGGHTKENVVPACAEHNSVKGNRPVFMMAEVA